jgi:hypothetical protein
VIGVPGQASFAEAAMEIEGEPEDETLITIPYDEALFGTAHGKFGSAVTVQFTTSPFFREEVANESLFVPTFEPFTFH